MSFYNHNNTVGIYRKTNTGNNVNPVYSYSLIDSVSCTKTQLSENRVIRDEGEKILADHLIYIDYTSTININDTLQIGSDEFVIYRIFNPNDLNHHLEIFCRKQEPGINNV